MTSGQNPNWQEADQLWLFTSIGKELNIQLTTTPASCYRGVTLTTSPCCLKFQWQITILLNCLWWLFHKCFKRGASTPVQDGECKSEPAEKMPRKDSDNSFNDGDSEMEDKDVRKTVTIKKRKEVGNKKKRYLPVVPLT